MGLPVCLGRDKNTREEWRNDRTENKGRTATPLMIEGNKLSGPEYPEEAVIA